MLRRFTASVAILASCISIAASAQTAASPPRTSEQPEVTRIHIENSAVDIAWTREQHVSERTLDVPSNVAWSAYPAAFADLGLEPNIIDSDQMIFGSAASHRHTLAKKRLSHFFDCGNMLGVSTADSYEVWVRIISQIVPIDGRLSAVRSQVEATANASDLPGGSVRCSSNGLLESRLAALLVEEAAKLGK